MGGPLTRSVKEINSIYISLTIFLCNLMDGHGPPAQVLLDCFAANAACGRARVNTAQVRLSAAQAQ